MPRRLKNVASKKLTIHKHFVRLYMNKKNKLTKLYVKQKWYVRETQLTFIADCWSSGRHARKRKNTSKNNTVFQ